MNHFNTWFCSRGSHIFVTKKFISAGYKTRSLNITMQPQCSSYLDHLAVNKQRVYVSLSLYYVYIVYIIIHRYWYIEYIYIWGILQMGVPQNAMDLWKVWKITVADFGVPRGTPKSWLPQVNLTLDERLACGRDDRPLRRSVGVPGGARLKAYRLSQQPRCCNVFYYPAWQTLKTLT